MATQLDGIERHEEVELKRSHVLEGKMSKPTAPAKIGMAIFGVALVVGLVYARRTCSATWLRFITPAR